MSITRHHNEWLTLVPNSGPFLSIPVLTQVFPQGLNAHDVDHARRLRAAFGEWDDNQSGPRPDPTIHRAWIKFVLGETLEFEELLAEGQAILQTLKTEIAEYGEPIRPDWVVNDPATQTARLLVQSYPRSQSLNKPLSKSRSNLSPDTRMMQLLRDTGIQLGIVTNGEHWMLVNAPKNETTGYISWFAHLWLDEPLTLRAFRTLLCAERFFGVQPTDTIESLLDRSAEDQQEVTDQLGYQVRKAVEVLIQALDKADQDNGRKLLADVNEKVLYEAALTVMMRLVFLFCAEERELLLLGDDLYDKNYAVSTLREQLRATADQFGEEILGLRYDAWTRLLTTFRAVYGGAKHDRLKLPAYGGSLFNPDRFNFLEGRPVRRNERGDQINDWRAEEATPLPVSNRTVLHLLEALQMLQVQLPGGGKSEARKLSFSELGIEQIGHVYEGLLDHTAKRATEPVLGLKGTREKEPEIALAELERLKAKGEKELLDFLKDETGRSTVSPIKKALAAEIDDQLASRFRTACQDSQLWERVKPFAGLVRLDTTDYPVVITPNSVFVTAGPDRRSSGTHYTPKSLTEPIVEHTLDPLVYFGPAEGLPRSQWRLKTPTEILALKICDMACGSGAFLVQACRYLAGKLQEAWKEIERAVSRGEVKLFVPPPFASSNEKEKQPEPRTSPFGFVSEGKLPEQLLPASDQDREILSLRLIAQRCLYGVDKNHLAVEMAKLSLWLLTLAKDMPFEFLDHAIRCGDSLVGITHLDQLRHFSLDPEGPKSIRYKGVIMDEVGAAVEERLRIERMPVHSVEDVQRQEELLKQSVGRLKPLRQAADLLVAASLWKNTPTEREEATRYLSVEANKLVESKSLAQLEEMAKKECRGQWTFHWPLEFPEVMVERGGFDAFIGNPPFMPGKRISSTLGVAYESYVKSIVPKSKGAADICCYFLRRAFDLCSDKGNVGLIATKSIAEGDSRIVGLVPILDTGGTLYWAWHEIKWPGSATVAVSLVILTRREWSGVRRLNERDVESIGSRLTISDDEDAHPLQQNKGICSDGTKIQGEGFIITSEERDRLIAVSANNEDVIAPYITGKDMVQGIGCLPGAYIVNFGKRSRSEAASYQAPFELLVDRVQPYRDALTGQIHEKDFWKFWDKREEFFASMASEYRILACPSTSKFLIMAFLDKKWIASHSVKLFAFADFGALSMMQSSIHECWARTLSGKLRIHLAYNLSRAFATFPLLAERSQLNDIGERYSTCRNEIAKDRGLCITDVYNLFHRPTENSADIQCLRDLHVELDRAVADAYGWSALNLRHDFHDPTQDVCFTISEAAQKEIMQSLLVLNHKRYAEEVAKGLHEKDKPKVGNTKQAKPKAKSKPEPSGPDLFAGEEDA